MDGAGLESWHAAVVHFPIAFAVAWPVVDLAGLLLRQPAVSWTAVGLLVAAVLASLVATATGQSEYDAAYAQGVALEVLDAHADYANLVPWALLGALALRLWAPTRLRRAGHALGIAAGVAVLGWVLVTGWTGGTLVYRHGVGVSGRAGDASGVEEAP